MPVFSLPSRYGIGSLGSPALGFAEFLHSAGQTLWQMLPLGPTGFADSPYQSFSSFAGNPYLIDLDMLAGDGLLTSSELSSAERPDGYIDYGDLYSTRFDLLRKACARFGGSEALRAFAAEEPDIADYALFMALKRRFGMAPWYGWPEDIRRRSSGAVERWQAELEDEINFELFMQYEFSRQFSRLRARCRELGVFLIGDMPMYPAPDSADVWASPGQFQLDGELRPVSVAGVPPDYFSETGQLWGNPLYRWDAMERGGFAWWRRRIGAAAKLYDCIRLDHFRALESYWSVPAAAETAAEGRWLPGPGKAFTDMLARDFPGTSFIAEDLGLITEPVHELRRRAGMPGMAVLSFAFEQGANSSYLPHALERMCACCTGTHDNDTLAGLIDGMTDEQRAFTADYCGGASPRAVIRAGMASCADIFIAQMQDWLGLGSGARINTPGVPGGSWRWRLGRDELSPQLAFDMLKMTQTFDRLPAGDKEEQPNEN